MILFAIHKRISVIGMFFFPIIKLGFTGVAKFANVLTGIVRNGAALLTPRKRQSGNDKCDYEYVPHNIDLGYKNTNF